MAKSLGLRMLQYGWMMIFFFTVSGCGSSRKTIVVEDGWELLGQQKVNFVRDKDELDVSTEGRYTAIKFMVEEHSVHINDLKVYFSNGDKLDPSMDDELPADQYSRIIELGREGRVIDKLGFKYRSTGNILKGRANVLVFGRKYDPYRY
jgi:hypothetical protein